MEEQQQYKLRELIRNLVRSLGLLDKTDISDTGITIAQCHAIVEIGRAKEISLNDLSNKLMVDKSTMSRTIDKLVTMDLVLREMHEKDRRYITIRLTDKGNGKFNKVEESMAKYYGYIFYSIPEEKREQVIESLSLLTAAISNK